MLFSLVEFSLIGNHITDNQIKIHNERKEVYPFQEDNQEVQQEDQIYWKEVMKTSLIEKYLGSALSLSLNHNGNWHKYHSAPNITLYRYLLIFFNFWRNKCFLSFMLMLIMLMLIQFNP